MIYWHSHILPEMDDGSRDVAESISMLEMLTSQGVLTVVATPHFYANDESVEQFLERREQSFGILQKALPENAPQIILGAEVRYYAGISHMENLKSLRIQGTKLLLLEMPMATWTEYMIRELIELASQRGIRLVLAHIERYIPLQKRETWIRLARNGIIMQVNASYFISLASRRKAISRLVDGDVQLLGTDCHNMTNRPPKMGQATDFIRKKLGDDYLTQMCQYGYALLNENN